jgi:hypothetical protein
MNLLNEQRGALYNRSSVKQFLGAGAGFLGGAVIGVIAVRAVPELGLSRGQAAAAFVLLPLLWLASIAVHELGHVIGGRLGGFRTLLFIVGPFKLERTADGFRPGLNRSIALAGGLAAMVPAGMHDLRRRTLVMVACGPLASLMLGTQVLALFHAFSGFLFRPDAGFASQLVALMLLGFGLMSLLIGMVTLVPAHTGGFYSDGARLLRLRRATDETEREVALIALVGQSMGGSRPRDWDSGLVESCAGICDGGPFEVGGRQFAYAHALDRGDIDGARTHLEAALQRIDQVPSAARAALLYAATTFYALYDGDAERARSYLSQARSGLLAAPHQRQLAVAAVLLADGDVAGARDAARRVEPLAAAALDRGAAALDTALAGHILVTAQESAG